MNLARFELENWKLNLVYYLIAIYILFYFTFFCFETFALCYVVLEYDYSCWVDWANRCY